MGENLPQRANLERAQAHVMDMCLTEVYQKKLRLFGLDEELVISHIDSHQWMAPGKVAVQSLVESRALARSTYDGRAVLLRGDGWEQALEEHHRR